MKVHLVKNEKDAIKGYKAVCYVPPKNLNNIESLSNNECEFILAGDIIDDFKIDEIVPLLQLIISKMRMNSTLVIGGTDLRIFCKNVINGMISEIDASEIISRKNSMTNLNMTMDIIQKMGLKIQYTKITGTHYEISAIRNSN